MTVNAGEINEKQNESMFVNAGDLEDKLANTIQNANLTDEERQELY